MLCHHARVADRVDFHGDGIGDSAQPGGLGRIGGHHGRGGGACLQIFDDGQRLGHHVPVNLQCRHKPLRVAGQMVRRAMLLLQQIHSHRLIGNAFQVQRDAHAIAGR